MNFMLGFSRSKRGRDFIFVFKDRFFFFGSHFISCNKTDDATNIIDLFFKEIVQLHRVYRSIVFDCDVEFFLLFLKGFIGILEIKLLFSTTYHP